MIETRRLKNVVIFIQTLSFAVSRKIINIYNFIKNFFWWLLLGISEYYKIFKSIYDEKHLQMAVSENVFMKVKKLN